MASGVVNYKGGIPPLPVEMDRLPATEAKALQQEVTFKILCPSDLAGGVIGRRGTIVKALENETGASICVGPPVAESDERLITITASESPESRYSAAQKAVVLVFTRSIYVASKRGLYSGSSEGSPAVARLVAPPSQVGCLLGGGGSVISEIRRVTGANVGVTVGGQVPKCASEDDEVVQIEGNFNGVKKALVEVTGRLQEFPPGDKIVDKATASGSRTLGSTSYQTLPDLQADLPQQNPVPPAIASDAVNYNGGIPPLPVEMYRLPAIEAKALQQEVTFKILCPNDRAGGVIGTRGTTVKALENETGASISFGPFVDESDERLITITASEGPESRYSAAQKAVVLVFARSIDVAAEKCLDSGSSKGSPVVARLIVPPSQVGCLLGKGGSIISEIRRVTRANIRMMVGDQVPKCASEDDEVVQIEGDVNGVKKALVAVTGRLQEFPPGDKIVDKAKAFGSRTLGSMSHQTLPDLQVDLPQRNPVLPAMASAVVNYNGGSPPLPVEKDRLSAIEPKALQQEVTFKILCRNDRAGGVIGRGGTIVKALENETGASISVGPSVAESDERLITITASESPESRYSAAQKAVVLVFSRSIDAAAEKGLDPGASRGSPVVARLIVPPSQAACLLGKGGSIMAEIRRLTRANIRIMVGDQVPKCALEDDEVVQISGDFSSVQEALYEVTGRLRDNILPGTSNNMGSRIASSLLAETNPLGNLKDPASLGLSTSPGISPSLSRYTNLAHNADRLGLVHHLDQSSSPRLWTSQPMARVSQMGITDVGRSLTLQRRSTELGRSKSAIVTNTTIEIAVPENVIHCVYGDNGSNLARLRQISGAKVIVHEPHPGKDERTIVISGTPDETQAAQSLLHAFILTGS